MYADRYRRPQARPGSMAAAAAITAGMVAALMFSAPDVVPRTITTLILDPIAADPPEPEVVPPRPQPRAAAAARPRTEVLATDPMVAVPIDAPIAGRSDPLVFPDVPPVGNAQGVGVEPAPPVAPVLVEAAPDPRYAADFQPPYPPAQQRAGAEGRVTVRVLVGSDGRVRAVEYVRGDEGFFDATRRQALARWRFRPATRDGVPQESWHTMSVRFVLND